LRGTDVVFLPRHGRGHFLLPSELNFRANIYGFKKLGVDWIISYGAVGSLKEEIKPLDVVIPDQFFDRTNQGRKSTFFGEGIVAHISFADPVCPRLGDLLEEACRNESLTVHRGGTYINMEGPAFSTRAESNVYRQLGMDVIGMTNLVEAKLAREAEICYASISMVTDYDCWHEMEEDVTVEAIVEILMKNVDHAKNIIRYAAEHISGPRTCLCANSLEGAIFTSPERISEAVKNRLGIIISKYIK
jgi:5'-methylthioadenosine phosphorylase